MPPIKTTSDRYLDSVYKLLDPRSRELAPTAGDLGFSQGTVRGIDRDARTLTALVSTPNPDRYEEIVEPKAFAKWLDVFMTNPVFVAGHNYGGKSGEPTVIGHWVSMKVTDEGLLGTAKFASTPLAEQYWQLYAEGHMRAFSVGWLTHAWEMRQFTLTNDEKKQIRVFTDVELIEVSAVAIPANRESLVRAASAFRGETLEFDGDAVLSREMEEAIEDAITKTLTDPCGPIDSLIREVVAAVVAHGSCGHDDDLGGEGPAPETLDKGAAERVNKRLDDLGALLRRTR